MSLPRSQGQGISAIGQASHSSGRRGKSSKQNAGPIPVNNKVPARVLVILNARCVPISCGKLYRFRGETEHYHALTARFAQTFAEPLFVIIRGITYSYSVKYGLYLFFEINELRQALDKYHSRVTKTAVRYLTYTQSFQMSKMAGFDLSADRSEKRSDPFTELCGREKEKGIKTKKRRRLYRQNTLNPSTCQVRENSFS